jgi:hypothetical protein
MSTPTTPTTPTTPAPAPAPAVTTAAPAPAPATGSSSGGIGGFFSGILDTIKNMFVDKNTGKMNTTSVIATLVIGGIGAYMGSGSGIMGTLIGGLGGAAAGVLGAPLIGQLLSSLGINLGGTAVPGGVPQIPGMQVGQANPPLVTHQAPVQSPTPGVAASNTVIRSPALENMVIPTVTVSDAVTARTAAQRDAAKLAGGTANRETVEARWRDVTRQEKSIADFVATMEEYGRQRETYMGPNGERARLVNEIVARGGKTQAEAEAMVPTLPPLPESYTANRRASDRIQESRAIYEQERERGSLPSEYGNKPWNELDPVMQAGYAYNKVNQQVAAIKSDIDINKLTPVWRNGVAPFLRGHSAGSGQHAAVKDLPQPDFGKLDHWSWTSYGTSANAASVIIARLRDDPDAQINGEYATTTLRRYAEHARSRIQTDRRGEQDTYDEMGKVLQYVEAVEQRRALLNDLNQMNAPVQALEEFRRGPMEQARAQVNEFLTAKLPMLNSEISTRRNMAAGATVSTPTPGMTVTAPTTPAPAATTTTGIPGVT